MKIRRAAAAFAAAAVVAGCGGGPGHPARDLTVAGGVRGGVYITYAAGLADVVHQEDPWLRAGVLTTNGSVHNVALLRGGCADVAFVAADVAAVASAEDAAEGRDDAHRVVALARLYDEYVQLVARADGPVHSVADLGAPGVRVSLGAPGSGTAVIAKRIVEAAGMQVAGGADAPPAPHVADCPRADRDATPAPSAAPGPDPCQAEPAQQPTPEPLPAAARAGPGEVQDLGLNLNQSAARLAVGGLDAFFWSGGLPACPIRRLAGEIRIRLVDLGAEAAALAGDPRYADFYTPTTIPASSYGLEGPVRTLAVPNYLLALRGLDPAVAYAVTRALFAGGPRLASYAADARRLDIRSALTTRPLDLHPAAVRYYREAHGG